MGFQGVNCWSNIFILIVFTPTLKQSSLAHSCTWYVYTYIRYDSYWSLLNLTRTSPWPVCSQFTIQTLNSGFNCKSSIKSCIKNFIQTACHNKCQILPYVHCNFFQIFFVSLRNDNSLQSSSVCCQDFVFNSPNLIRRRNRCKKSMTLI